MEHHEKAMEMIADEHGRKVDGVQRLAGYSHAFKPARQAYLWNAKMLYKANEMNYGTCFSDVNCACSIQAPGQEKGDRAMLAEIQEAVALDEHLQNPTEEFEKVILDGLAVHRNVMKYGA